MQALANPEQAECGMCHRWMLVFVQLKGAGLMKQVRFSVLAIIAVVILIPGSAMRSVHAQVTRPFSVGTQVQNLASTEAEVTITLYNPDGTVAAEATDTIPANGNITYVSLDELYTTVPTRFRGSAIISSSERIAAIVNVTSPDVVTLNLGAAYIGFGSGARNSSLPLLFKDFGGFNTFFSVQNVSDTRANVTITYRGQGIPGTVQETAAIEPNTAQRFDQNANAQLPSNFVGSAVIQSDQDIAAAVVQVGPTTVLAYNGFTDATTNPYFPLINANNSGFITGISVQNTGTSDTDVTVSYSPSPGIVGNSPACTETRTVPANGGTAIFAVEAFDSGQPGENCADGELFVGSARVTANSTNQPLVAVVNQLNPTTNKAGAYSSFSTTGASSTIVFPVIQDRLFGLFTGFSIVNVGSTATTVTCTYSNSSATQSETLDPGEPFTAVQNNAIADGYNGSGICQASGSGRIIGIANQVRISGSADTFFVSEGLDPASSRSGDTIYLALPE
jgi:hypothetical protein